jgi:pSer/pThr/pTyr-binding forkhead associated (FHA) protein
MAKEARIEILKGNDAGAQFRIKGESVRFGRSADSDIVVTDSSASRNHAELVRVNNSFVIKDLNSSNGVFVNGKKIKEHYLASGDVFSIGTHEYMYVEKEATEERMSAPPPSRNREGTIPGISSSSMDVNIPSSSTGGGGLKNKRLVLYGGVLLVIVIFIIMLSSKEETKKDESTEAQTAAIAQNQNKPDDMSSDDQDTKFRKKIPDDERELFDQANEHYFEGQREFRLQNYSRALEEFRKSVSFYPGHTRARTAAGQTAKKIEEESQKYLAIGKKMYTQKRYEDALRNFNEVLNLNNRQPDSSLFKEAEKWKSMTEKRQGEVFEQ